MAGRREGHRREVARGVGGLVGGLGGVRVGDLVFVMEVELRGELEGNCYFLVEPWCR
jgi:hypothetical protein